MGRYPAGTMAKVKKKPARPTELTQQHPTKGETPADVLFKLSLGSRIVKAREHMGLSQAKLAELAGLSRTVLNGYEKGNTTPGARQIQKLCGSLGISPTQLIYGKEVTDVEPEPPPYLGKAVVEDVGMIAVLFQTLTPGEKQMLQVLLRSLFVEKHGLDALNKLDVLAPGLAAHMLTAVPAVEKQILSQPLSPELKAALVVAGEGEPIPDTLGEFPSTPPTKSGSKPHLL